MNISRYAKAVVYQITAAVLLIFAVRYQLLMHTAGKLETAYFASNRFLVIAAFVLFGTAVYAMRAVFRRHRDHKADVVFLLLAGLLLLAASVMIIINYGGLEAPFSQAGFIAVNINAVLLSALPVPFFIRGLVLALSRSDDKPLSCYIARGLCALVLAAIVAAVALGGMMRMVHYPDDIHFSAGSLDDGDRQDEDYAGMDSANNV